MVVLALSGAAAFGLAPESTLEKVPIHAIQRALPNPLTVSVDPTGAEFRAIGVDAKGPDEARYWHELRIRRGDTIGSVLARAQVDDPEAQAFFRIDPAARPLYRLRPGQPLVVETFGNGRLASLRFAMGSGDMLTIERRDGGFVATSAPAPVQVHWEMAGGEIATSLFAAADDAALPDSVTLQLADIFGGDIDFYHDLQRGDRFTVVYEMRYLAGEAVGAGRIVAAEFIHRGRALRAFRWVDAAGQESYFGENGAASRKAFLRSPMEFSRVASGFSASRLHPILQVSRAHQGIDYQAPVGTPVRATGSGTIAFVGVSGGFGRMIEIQHRGVHSTVYAHLSRFAPHLRRGSRVAQGEVIGFVGQTGLATGPHLHYEFRVDGVPRNPVSVATPAGDALPITSRAAFTAYIEPALQQLAFARSAGATLASAR